MTPQPAPADAAALAAALELQHVLLGGSAHGPTGAIRASGACDICRLIVAAALPVHPPAPPEPGAIARFLDKYGLTNTSGARHEARRAALAAARAALAPDSQTEALLAALAARGVYTPGDLEAMLAAAPPAPLPLDVERRLAEAERTIEAMSGDAADLTDLIGEAAAMRTVLGHLLGDDWGRIHDSGCATCDAGRALLSAEHELPSHAARIALLATPEPTEDGQP